MSEENSFLTETTLIKKIISYTDSNDFFVEGFDIPQ